MARLRDVRPVLRSYGTWAFIKRVWQQISEDGIFVWASALAYSWLFAVFPFLIFLLSLVPYLPWETRDHAQRLTNHFVEQLLGRNAATINDNIDILLHQPRHGWLGIGLFVSLWAASGGMSMTMSALDVCYDIKHGRSFFRQRLMATTLTIGVASLVLLVFVLIPVSDAYEHYIYRLHIFPVKFFWAFDIARHVLAVILMIAVLAVIYYFGPSIRQKFQPLSPGAVFSIVVWIALNLIFKYYVDRFARYDQTYGTVGGAAILLLFFYIDALVLLIGAEINSEIDFEILGVPSGSRDFTGKPGEGAIHPEL